LVERNDVLGRFEAVRTSLEVRMHADLAKVFLLLNLALAFYLVGCIWAHEVDIFRTWRLVGRERFPAVQRTHWRKLPYWIFAPLTAAFAGGIGLIWLLPAGSPAWGPWANFGLQVASAVMTALYWGPRQARLSRDPEGPDSVYLTRILRTHWVRTGLITAYGGVLLAWSTAVFAR
jgi:hypothetical protein